MSVVSLLGVKVLNNPAPFTAPYEFEITFECLEQLREDLEWKLTYVGSATSAEHDQELDSLLVGPIPIGVNKFIFEADPPNLSRLPPSEILGVTVILLTCSYDGREFVRVGYYVYNEYDDETLSADPPAKPVIEKIRRNVLAEKPRVTRFAIKWDSEESAPAEYPPDQPEADTLDDDGTAYGAEEAEMQAALERELEETEAKMAREDSTNGDQEMTDTAKVKDEDEEASDAESEDLEEESSESEDEEDDEEGAEGEDTEMAEGDDKPTAAQNTASADLDGEKKGTETKPEVMVH
ncbi:histone chaperone asf1 [Cladophialophora bantiana CBS 173.52]|uniref:Histone chaperone n=1 Tax=Cladophialophora bantiana (strain ATCC 10958 / CBS 173.52 / CDC B-1940 / NIH 8579) TaxID=1442370 RepID=A0A0D2HYL7_CLAB1|nr:histone chaperone asf1 [Cladophialophora bantiana CBS 173.52]KIW98508.1 histone chaperone asf1 [Cladophialophora bantiana CBS 173.52]